MQGLPNANANANASTEFRQNPIYKATLPFVIGCLSGSVATICLQPIDMVKVRLQLIGEGSKTGPSPNPFRVARDIVAQGKASELYSGLSAALLRQLVYGTSRLGLFFSFEDALKRRATRAGTNVTFRERAAAGLAAGGLGALIGTPTEVALIRMQSDGMRPPDQRANYRSAFDAINRIVRNEGLLALWSGANATVVRAMCTNFGQLAFFSEAKGQLQKVPAISDQTRTLAAAAVGGFFAAFFSMPLDFVKTRLQRQSGPAQSQSRGQSPGQSLHYRGMWHCFTSTLKTEGLLRFYRGFGTYFLRMAPHTVISLVIADNLSRLLKKDQ
ncbi:hypothetical protein A1O3_04163 [Capronia epimyces CBS 606.96]|uniref:Mitochondrial thiamine pyrophosphate carrier 1 n=1 Tax=Capronia epimyces CBS 606.96 TaxID=1182542 RepID=W9YY25_9EURO|nr:uncharacterized protein A1O3_04163 [Capronia epimyces CBS 606.96]EXJ87204.1 hypothetical protein A1O3_04163 [Capronia epimyces CBS 606.96]